jgi:hypothetical protein
VEPKTETKPVAEKGPMEQPAYRGAFLRELMRLTHTREAADPAPFDTAAAKVPHSISILKRIGQSDAFIVATVGFGRVAHAKKGPANVELLAYVESFSPNVERVLSKLGDHMHARGADAPPWKDYDTVQLPAPELGLQYFDLRPAGELSLGPDLTVKLLKVIPMTADEYESSQKNPAREYDDPNEKARSIERWRRVVEKR